MKDMQSKLYPAVIVLLSVVLLAVLFGRFQVTVSEPDPEVPMPPIAPSSPIAPPSVSIAPASRVAPSPAPIPVAPSLSPSPASSTVRLGSLRVSNQTDHPVRVALLPQAGGAFGQPVQWDFAPQEGSGKGLRLSLPNGDLKIRAGDVVVAFAEDGTRRYWGPFVAGKTDLPIWEASEWQLVLQP